jgi:YidC/Oxa1 family membrane protein insertase
VIQYFIVLQQVEDLLKAIITYYHDHLGVSWGLAIVMLTATVRLAILPLTIKQFRSMAAMQRIQPKVKALQNKYKGKGDRESKAEMQKELMALYKEHNVNPFASCLPLVFQMPVIIGLYQMLRSFHPGTDTAFLGIDDIFVVLGKIGGTTEYVMVVLYAISMLGSMLLFSFVPDRQQKFMFAGASMIFIGFIIRVPAGVGLYWITTNIWTICQNGMVKRTMGHHFPVVQKQEKGKGDSGQPRSSRNPRKTPKSGGQASTPPARGKKRR